MSREEAIKTRFKEKYRCGSALDLPRRAGERFTGGSRKAAGLCGMCRGAGG